MFWFIYKVTLLIFILIYIAAFFKNKELLKQCFSKMLVTGEILLVLIPVINTLFLLYCMFAALMTTINDE